MRHPIASLLLRVAIGTLLFALAASAVDLVHYDLDSLTYLSTDIVVAEISVMADHRFAATVTETLQGPLVKGVRLERLSEFLMFFRPMENGQEVVLFLDRRPRPHWPYFPFPEASRSLFAVPSSGVYLIDGYQHVHEYYQLENPGAYIAEGYRYMLGYRGPPEPTKEEDLALPSLREVEARISASLKWVHSIRPLLDKVADRADIPVLMSLLKKRLERASTCDGRNRDAIAARIAHQLRSLNDPGLMLTIYPVSEDGFAGWDFIETGTGQPDKSFTASRVTYLIQTLSDPKKNVQLRMNAAEILFQLGRAQTSPGPSSKHTLMDNEWLASSADEIRAKAKAILDDDAEGVQLRGLCLRFLKLGQPDIVADMKRVYASTQSEELQFAIEKSFLEASDALYESLDSPGGPIASIVRAASEYGCVKAAPGDIGFFGSYYERQDFFEQFWAEIRARSTRPTRPFLARYFVLTNERTGVRFVFGNIRQSWVAGRYGEDWIELSQSSDLPRGDYSMTLEYSRGGALISRGHELRLAVIDTPEGRKLTVK